jgi:preprotein translocase subunit SecD
MATNKPRILVMRFGSSLLILAAVAMVPMSVTAKGSGRDFSIGGLAFAEKDIVDARAQPQVDGSMVILLSFDDPAARKLADLTAARISKPVPVQLNGKTIMEPVVREAVTTGQMEISGRWTLSEAERLAKLISGKDPLPESMEEE